MQLYNAPSTLETPSVGILLFVVGFNCYFAYLMLDGLSKFDFDKLTASLFMFGNLERDWVMVDLRLKSNWC